MSGEVDRSADDSETTGSPLWAKVGTVIVGLVLVGFIALLATRDDEAGSGVSRLLGRAVPELEGTTLDGGSFDIDAARGRWVLVNFFASWCVPCEVEHPELVDFSERHDDGSAVVVSVLMGDTPENGRAFFDLRGGDWPVIIDADSAPARFSVPQVPETFLVSPSGLVAGHWTTDFTADSADEIIQALS
ncbi:MAG: TlpA family protein disulfide reductase [Actinomycetia bacterium]|nr:TlpA family protein disulfide reductase [Actinomycetes bacterium]MCP4960728.1 TlpA family protein disulfide reductase [Actinomycetes bacterium]